MTLVAASLLVVALALAAWVLRRAIRYRREAQSREARALEALFLSRHTGDGGASIDLDKIFGTSAAAASPMSAEVALRAAGLPPELVALLKKASAEQVALETAAATAATAAGAVDLVLDDEAPAATPAAAAVPIRPAAPQSEPPAPVRDLVQVFYEARGFHPAPADPSARPIELVLAHKSDAQRAYAFVPLAEAPSKAALQSIIDVARAIGQTRLLIAVEGTLPAGFGQQLPAHGVRVFDRAAMNAQLARLDGALSEKIRAAARSRAPQRLEAG